MPAETVAPKRRRRWLRALVWLFALFIILLVAVYFIATSSAFFKSAILPRVGKALNAEVTVSDAEIHPFHEVVLRELKVQTTGLPSAASAKEASEPLLSVPEARAHYSLWDILSGNIKVEDVSLSSPTVTLVENPDGTSNLDPLFKAPAGAPAPAPAQQAPAKPLQIDLKKLVLSEAIVRKIKLYPGGAKDVAEISSLNVNLAGVKNGQAGNLTLSADIAIENHPPGATNALLKAKLDGAFDFSMSQDLKPSSIQGHTRLDVTRAGGAFGDLATLGAQLDCDVTPEHVKQLALKFQKSGAPLGQVLVSGPFALETREGRLSVEVHSIDKQVLNLAGASSGIDFGTTILNSTNQIQLASAGAVITAAGQFDAAHVQLTRNQQTTPSLDLQAAYSLTVSNDTKTAVLRALSITGDQQGRQLVHASLTRPMTLAWGNAAGALGDSTLTLALTNLNFADWKPFLGDVAPEGNASASVNLLAQQGGKQLTFDVGSQIANLTAIAGTNSIRDADITFAVSGKATDFVRFDLSNCKLAVAQHRQPLLTVSGSGAYNATNQAADLQLGLQANLAQVLQTMPQPGVSVSAGAVEFNGRLIQKPGTPGGAAGKSGPTQTVTGDLLLSDLTVHCGQLDLRQFSSTLAIVLTNTPKQLQLSKAAGKCSVAGKDGGSFALSATYDLTDKSAQLTARVSDLNENALRPFLQPVLADKKLVSVSINASLQAQYQPQSDSTCKGSLSAENLVVNDPKGQFPAAPLAATLLVDGSVRQQVADLRQFEISLTPTARATNQLLLSGKIDMTHSNAIQGDLKLAADSLDLTSYYDLFAGQQKLMETQTAPAAHPAPPTGPGQDAGLEPEPVLLPVHNFTTEINLHRLYLREVEVTDLQAAAQADGGRIVVSPFKLALNGAPLSATLDLDLGVPGWKYTNSFSAQGLPLAPLLDSFEPDRKGEMGGTVVAQANLAGAGVTGASLHKNLEGQFDFALTNLNLSVVKVRSALLKRVINVIGVIPQLARNPETALGSLLGGQTGQGSLSDDLAKSPIDLLAARGSAGSGRIDLQHAVVRSSAFEAEAQGKVSLAPQLTNSTIDIPVAISLSRPIAEKIKLVSADTPTNAAYARLPDFLTMKGTLGQPKEDINKLALAGAAFKGISGVVPVGGKTGQALQGIEGILGGHPAAATNAPPGANTNQSPVNDLLNLFKKPK